MTEKTSAEITRDYIGQHPSIMDCLSYDIVNFSALARKIMEETGAKKRGSGDDRMQAIPD